MALMEQEINIVEIPRLNIQWDWKEALRNPGGKAWISCSRINRPTVYGDLVKARDSEDNVACNSLNLEASNGFSVKNVDKVGNRRLCYKLYFSFNFNRIRSSLTPL